MSINNAGGETCPKNLRLSLSTQPALGYAVDLLVQAGGTAVLSETP
ncbi:MAG: UxaA family hydrolase [Desulfobacterales bacterium]|nr:MAG: UxaA family hydrolase [Desulfobacterales bacterium]